MEKFDLSSVRHDKDRKLIYRIAPKASPQEISPWLTKIEKVRSEIHTRLIGQSTMVNCLLMGLLAGRHILLQGGPGSGKSTAIQAFCESLELESGIADHQNDFMGKNILIVDGIERRNFEFRTQLRRVMQGESIKYREEETHVTQPFMVLATAWPSNPLSSHPLHPAEKDHFMLSCSVSLPGTEDESRILRLHQNLTVPSSPLNSILGCAEILEIQRLIYSISLDENEENYLLKFIKEARTRNPQLSVRTTLDLALASKSQAFLNSRERVAKSDIDTVLPFVLEHRLHEIS